MDPTSVEVVHVGSACRDIASDDPRGWRLGGGVTYAALTTARFGVRTAAIVGVDRQTTDCAELGVLEAAGVRILRVPLAAAPVFDNRETAAGRVQTCVQLGEPLAIPAIPGDWLMAPGWSLVPVAGEIGDEWAAQVPPTAHLAVAWQGFLRELSPGVRVARRPPRRSPVLDRADLTGVSGLDLEPGTPREALWLFLKPGASLLLTDGPQGGTWIRLGADGPLGSIPYPAIPPAVERDPTGAGDTTLAAFHAVLLQPGLSGSAAAGPAALLRFAAAAGSLVVEGRGLDGVPTLGAILRRAAPA